MSQQGQSESFLKRSMENLFVSGLSASVTHIPHHPLYTLKSQMMYYGKEFRFRKFFKQIRNTGGTFLFQGKSMY